MPLEIEEELDLSLLGLEPSDVGSTVDPDPIQIKHLTGSPEEVKHVSDTESEEIPPHPLLIRIGSGRYRSADWDGGDGRIFVAKKKDETASLRVTTEVKQLQGNSQVVKLDATREEYPHLTSAPQSLDQAPNNIVAGIIATEEERSQELLQQPKSPSLRVQRYLTRVPGSRRSRVAYRVISLREDISEDELVETEGESTESPPREFPDGSARDFVEAFGLEAYEKIEALAKTHATTGQNMPNIIRDLFPSLSDLQTAIHVVNTVRRSLDLPLISSTKSTRIAILRALAQSREALYIHLLTSLTLPKAPLSQANAEDIPNGDHLENDLSHISLTPNNLQKMAKSIPKAFPAQKILIKSFLGNSGRMAFGEQSGEVVWQGGIGRLVGAEGGFRGKLSQDGDVQIFVDHSNILYGLLHCLYSRTSDSLPPKHLRELSLPALSLLLRRGRFTPPGTLHAVASSPLKQDLDPLVRLGWEVSVLKRVEILEDEVEDPSALNLTAKPMLKIPSGEGTGLRRYKEQAVDEILHLKLLQTLNAKEGKKYHGSGTIVLATGDAKGGQFNREGFVGAVREAIKRGWTIELWSFKAGLSRVWHEVAKREKWADLGSDGVPRFKVHHLDEWAEELVEVNSSHYGGL